MSFFYYNSIILYGFKKYYQILKYVEKEVSIRAWYGANPARMRAKRAALTDKERWRKREFEDFSPTKREEHLGTS